LDGRSERNGPENRRRINLWASPGLMDTLEGRCAWGF
jgi:hypothetical protein